MSPRPGPGGRGPALGVWLLGVVLGLAAAPAGASSAQGYAVVLTPVAHQGDQRLLVHALERSDPNTAAAAAVLPSMLKERAWWLVIDASGHQRCSLSAPAAGVAPAALRAADSAAQRMALSTRLRKACGAWTGNNVAWLVAAPAAGWRWSPEQVCAGTQCTAAATAQRSLRGARSLAVAGAAPAPARCIAGRWLIVTNRQADEDGGHQEGARFAGLPPALRGDIVGHETVRVDGVAAMQGALSCP